MELHKIGYFQFDNLVKNRVPFLFVNMGQTTDFLEWYTIYYRTFIEQNLITTTPEQLLNELTKRQTPKEAAIILLCKDGQDSLQSFGELNTAGYTNVYVINGGYQQMVTERATI